MAIGRENYRRQHFRPPPRSARCRFTCKATRPIRTNQRSTIQQQIDAGLAWLQQQQNSDGGFGDTTKSHSNISTTMLVVAAIHAAGRTDGLSSNYCQPPKRISNRPGRNRWPTSSLWQRQNLRRSDPGQLRDGGHRWTGKKSLPCPSKPLVFPQRFYHLMQLPVVSYAIPALVAIGQVKFHFRSTLGPDSQRPFASCQSIAV